VPTTSYAGLPYPVLSNAPNVPQDMQNLADALDTLIKKRTTQVVLAKSTASIANNSVTTINWSSAIKNNHGLWTAGSPSLITVPYSGTYMAFLSVRFASDATASGFRQSRVDVGGAEQMVVNIPATSALNSTNMVAQVSHPMLLTAGDQITFKVYQNSGGALDIVGNTRCAVWLMESD
jgi:hypothetical protein